MKLITILGGILLAAGCQSSHSDVAQSRGASAPGNTQQDKTERAAKAGKPKLAIDELPAPDFSTLQVSSPVIHNDDPIPATYSEYGEKSSPPLRWVGTPARTQSIAVIVDDPDAMEPKPFVHWVLYNLPPAINSLRTAVPATGQVRQLMDAKQGMNSFGSLGYFGPKPPIGDPPHHYHFQVFALDTMLDLEQGATKAQVIDAARGHVLAKGEVVGTFAKPK